MASPESIYSPLEVSDIQPFVPSLLESNYIGTFLVFIHKFIQTPIKFKNSKRTILDALSFHYPDSFSLRLVKLLSLNPPIHIRIQAALLLQQTLTITPNHHLHRIGPDILLQLKPLTLELFKFEIQEQVLRPLAAAIADLACRIDAFPSAGWLELLEYIVSSVTLNSYDNDYVLRQRKGLMLLADLRWNIVQHVGFWKNSYSYLSHTLMARMTDRNADKNSQALTLAALRTVLNMAQPLGKYKIGGSILLIILEYIDQHSNEMIVLKRVRDLRDFVSLDVGLVLSGIEENVFQAMLRIADTIGVSKELRCAAIDVLNCLWEDRLSILEAVMKKVSDVDAQRVVTVSMVMMFESERKCFELGKSLLIWLSLRGEGNSAFHMLMGFFKAAYPASNDLKKRHRVMLVIAQFVENITDGSILDTEIMKMITDEINHVISIIVERVKAEEAGTFEGGSEYLPDIEIFRSSNLFLSTTIKKLRDRVSPYAGELYSTIAQLLDNDFPDRVKAIVFSFWNTIGPFFSDECYWNKYHDTYAFELLKAKEGSLRARMETARGIGICATFGGQKFKPIINEAISKLYSLLEHEHSIKGEESCYGADKTDMAVVAFGIIIEFHWENIVGRPEVIQTWLSFLPLTDNLNLAKYVHALFFKMLKRKDVDVLGPKNENLPKILSILRTISLRRDELAMEKFFSEMIGFLDKHGDDM